MSWGLIPFWVKDNDEAEVLKNHTINARGETVFEKPAFRTAIRDTRCLIPVTGFFDWRHDGKIKTPYFISLKKDEIFSLAGMYDLWTDPDTNQSILSFSVITTEANEFMKEIHNVSQRMPLIISEENEKNWLDKNSKWPDIKKLIKPYENNDMNAYIIQNDFMHKNPFDKTILDKRI